MIHTVELSVQLDKDHLQFRNEQFGNNSINQILHTVVIMGVSITEFRNKQSTYCKVIIDIPLILNRGNVEEEDYEIIEKHLRRTFSTIYGDEQLYDQHKLKRIDFRLDTVVRDGKIIYIYFKLFSKLKKKIFHLKKRTFTTSQYHQCKSLHTICYDKEKERLAKNEPVKEWERDVLRFEVCIKRAHLDYKKYKKGEPKHLKNYFRKVYFRYLPY